MIVKKILKLILVFVFSTSIIYLALTLGRFINWCNKNQIPLFKHNDARGAYIINLDEEKIQEIGNNVGAYQKAMEQGLATSPYKDEIEEHTLTDGHTHTVAEFYDPLGFSVWSYLDRVVQDIVEYYAVISIILGISISMAYVVITSKKMKNIFKFIVGYFGVILIIPPVYKYNYTHRFWDISEMYFNTSSIKFYILYTVIFLLMFAINFIISKKVAQKLNEEIKSK